ncbi:hypothetical protein [Brucella sp. 10RB9213]|uniref:hypothetical protein n=1 Tax=Brucella sp. 10RB9213 TaxID=1844039 RepID=UPI0012ADC702|nr:hypothetical protein [Brucella sp. 10RB9213]MRN67962.1 hypothetical protein [Brucella sp. 10RB9213]
MEIVNFGLFKPTTSTGIVFYENEDGRDWYELRRGLTSWDVKGNFVNAVYGAWALVDPESRAVINVEYDPSRLVPHNKIVLGIDADWTEIKTGMIFDGENLKEPPPPTPEERRAMMRPLEKWRVDTIIDLEPGLRDKINAVIARWPDPKRTIAKNKLASVTEFYRIDPLFDELGSEAEIGKSPDDIDAMWADGAALPPALI